MKCWGCGRKLGKHIYYFGPFKLCLFCASEVRVIGSRKKRVLMDIELQKYFNGKKRILDD